MIPNNLEISAKIYHAFDQSNVQNSVKRLDQVDRAIALVALNNIHFAGQRDRVEQIDEKDAQRVVANLTNHSIDREPSSLLQRLIKGIQNLFGRISSATVLATFNEVKENDVPNLAERLAALRAEVEAKNTEWEGFKQERTILEKFLKVYLLVIPTDEIIKGDLKTLGFSLMEQSLRSATDLSESERSGIRKMVNDFIAELKAEEPNLRDSMIKNKHEQTEKRAEDLYWGMRNAMFDINMHLKPKIEALEGVIAALENKKTETSVSLADS